MTNAQNYSAVGVATVKWTKSAPLDVNREMGVECGSRDALQQQGNPVQMSDTAWTQKDAVEFFSVLRCALLQIVRWIERKYPELKSNR